MPLFSFVTTCPCHHIGQMLYTCFEQGVGGVLLLFRHVARTTRFNRDLHSSLVFSAKLRIVFLREG